jgi:hypothetical protein
LARDRHRPALVQLDPSETNTRSDCSERALRLRPRSAEASESSVSGDHWCGSLADGIDDLGVVDGLQVDRRDAEVGVSELSLDHDERNALAGRLDGVGVTKLVRCGSRRTLASEAARRSSTRAAAADQGRPRVGPWMTQNTAPTGICLRV